jgi:hypothetical protein
MIVSYRGVPVPSYGDAKYLPTWMWWTLGGLVVVSLVVLSQDK